MVRDWTVPSALVAGGLLLGLIAERIVLPRLQRYAVARRWVGGDLFIASLHGVTLAFFLIAGLYVALLAMALHPATLTIVHKGFLVALIPLGTIVLARIAGELASSYGSTLHRRKGAEALP